MDNDLEKVVKEKIKPLIEESTTRYLGVNIEKLSDDITAKLDRSSLIDLEVDTRLPYKEAKNKFKKSFLTKLLLLNLGNVSTVAKITGKNRRSIHRLIRRFGINIKKIKKELIRPYDMKLSAMSSIIGHVLDDYKSVLHPDRLDNMYANVSSLSEGILKEMPQPRMTFEEAQKEFEKRYFEKALKENSHNFAKTAKHIGLRYETLNRKLRKLNMI